MSDGQPLDDTARQLLDRIAGAVVHEEVLGLMDRLNQHLFDTYCAKAYLDEPDPGETCSYYLLGTCGYVNSLKTVHERSGVNLVRRTR